MNRRSFLIYSGLSAIAIALGIGRYASHSQKENIVTLQPPEPIEEDNLLRQAQPTEALNVYKKIDPVLVNNLERLFDISFKGMAEGVELLPLLTTLKDKNVIDAHDEINISRVKELALGDGMIQYNGWYYSQTEFELYGLAYMAHGTEIEHKK